MNSSYAAETFVVSLRRGSPLLWRLAIVLTLGLLACVLLQQADGRLIAGASVWSKPAKFFLSLAVQSLTLTWAISLLPKPARGVTAASWAFMAALAVEMAYMIFRASRAEASHFNTATPVAAAMYAIMGAGALTLTGVTGFVGYRVWQQRGMSLMREAAGLGLMLGALLGTAAGAYMSAQTGHSVGGDITDASGLRFFHWSTAGGDLRVAHFLGLHTSQFVPFAALSGHRGLVWLTAAACVLAAGLAFVQAMLGVPLLKAVPG